jgi:hypothetical protein
MIWDGSLKQIVGHTMVIQWQSTCMLLHANEPIDDAMVHVAPGRWPEHPGVPLFPQLDGFHWLRWPVRGRLTVGEWSAGIGRWITHLGDMSEPEDLAHLDYVGPAVPPVG